jgi:hypothetical protein
MAKEFYATIIPIVMELHNQGLSLREIGRELEKRGIKPQINYGIGKWGPAQVRRALIRGQEEEERKANEKKEASAPKAPVVVSAPKAPVSRVPALPAVSPASKGPVSKTPATKAPTQKEPDPKITATNAPISKTPAAPSAHSGSAEFR